MKKYRLLWVGVMLSLIIAILPGKVGAVLILDAGHGSPDGGTMGYSGSIEKDINLAIVQKTSSFLNFIGVKHIFTRTGDRAIYDEKANTIREKKVSDLKKRLLIGNGTENAYFISFHMNASTTQKANGIQIFYGTSYQSSELAACLTSFFLSQPSGHHIRESKSAPESVFLTRSLTCPCVILEYGYLTNPQEEALLVQDLHQNKLSAITSFGLLKFINQRG